MVGEVDGTYYVQGVASGKLVFWSENIKAMAVNGVKRELIFVKSGIEITAVFNYWAYPAVKEKVDVGLIVSVSDENSIIFILD